MSISVGTSVSLGPTWDFEYVNSPQPLTNNQRAVWEVDAEAFNAVYGGTPYQHWGVIVNVTSPGAPTQWDRRGNRLWRNGTGLIFHGNGHISEEVWFNNSTCQRDAHVRLLVESSLRRFYRVTINNYANGYRAVEVLGRNSTGASWEELCTDNRGGIVSTRRTPTTCLFITEGSITGTCTQVSNL